MDTSSLMEQIVSNDNLNAYVRLIEPPLAEPHERWCERSEIPQSEEFPPTRLPGRSVLAFTQASPAFHLLAIYISTAFFYA